MGLDAVINLLHKNSFGASNTLSRALKAAVNQGHGQIVKLLIKNVPKTTRNLDPTLLCRAAELGYQEIVLILIKVGANINATYEGNSPLQLAARNGHDSIVYILLCQNADPNLISAKNSPIAI